MMKINIPSILWSPLQPCVQEEAGIENGWLELSDLPGFDWRGRQWKQRADAHFGFILRAFGCRTAIVLEKHREQVPLIRERPSGVV